MDDRQTTLGGNLYVGPPLLTSLFRALGALATR
jgi:hypothetical protein